MGDIKGIIIALVIWAALFAGTPDLLNSIQCKIWEPHCAAECQKTSDQTAPDGNTGIGSYDYGEDE